MKITLRVIEKEQLKFNLQVTCNTFLNKNNVVAIISDCLTIGSEVLARWNSVKEHTRYFHGFITKVRKTSVEVSPSGKDGAKVNEIVERPRAKQFYVIIDKKSKPAEIKLGSEVIVASKDNYGFSQGKITQKFVTWYGVELGNGEKVWSKAHDIRLLRPPVYCDRE